MNKFVDFFKIAALILLVLGCVTPPSFAGHGDDDDFYLMGFDARNYLQINPFLEKKYIAEAQLDNTEAVKGGKLVPTMRDDLYNWLTDYARKSIQNDDIECLPWVYGSKTFGIKALAQINSKLHDQFRASFFPKGVIRKGITPNKYKAFFARYIQDCMFHAHVSSLPFFKGLADAIPGPKAYIPKNPWCKWDDVVSEQSDSGKKEGYKATRYGSIGRGLHDSYFAAKGTDSDTSETDFAQILEWREGLRTPAILQSGKVPIEKEAVRTFYIDPNKSLITKPDPAEIDEHKGLTDLLKGQDLGSFQDFLRFENFGEGLCGFHGLGVDPNYFVDECIRRLNEGTNEEIEAVFAHVYFDLKSIRTRQGEQPGEFAGYEPIFKGVLGTENISTLSDEDLIKFLFNADAVRKQLDAEGFIRALKERKAREAGKFVNPLRDVALDPLLPHQAINNPAIRLTLHLMPCMNKERISNYLRARYTGLNGFKSRINGGFIEADNLNLIARIGGVGFVTITDREPGANRIRKDKFVACCDEIFSSDSSGYKDALTNLLAQFIWEIKTHQEDIFSYPNMKFADPVKALNALRTVFGTDSLLTKFRNRGDVDKWLGESAENPMKFVRARFESADIRFARLEGSNPNLAYDPLVSNRGWVVIEDWRMPSLGNDTTGQPYLQTFNRIDYRIQGDFTTGRIVFLYLNGIHYSTLLPIGAPYDTFGESKYAMQMVLEDLSTWAKSDGISEASMNEYIKNLKTIYPKEEIDLALRGRVHPVAMNFTSNKDRIAALVKQTGMSETGARQALGL